MNTFWSFLNRCKHQILAENIRVLKRFKHNNFFQEKNYYIRELSRYVHKDKGRVDSLYFLVVDDWAILHAVLSSSSFKFIMTGHQQILKHLTYLGEIKPENSTGEFRHPGIGRKYYSYKKTNISTHTLLSKDIDWPFPDTYFKSIGLLVRGFQFLLPNLSNLLKSFFQPSADLINTESGTEEITTIPTQYSFYPEQEAIKASIKKYKNVPVSLFINESYFLYNESELIKETFATALRKTKFNLWSVSYFNYKKKQ